MNHRFELICMGRVGVDMYPEQSGPLCDVRTFAKSLGGSATNVAVAAARLGHDVSLITKVGQDALGEYVRAALTGFRVDTRWVGTEADLKTPIVIAELDPPEDPTLIFYRDPVAPDMMIDVADLDVDNIGCAGIVWVTGSGLSAEPSRSATMAAVEAHAGSASRTATILDLDWRPSFWREPESARACYEAALTHATIAVGNRAEVEVAVGTREPQAAAERLLAFGLDVAIVKLGADGVLVATSDGAITTVPPVPVEVVCGLGAGDAFGGALCHGLLAGWAAVDCVRFANAAGAIVASRLACADAMPTADEITTLMESFDGT